MPYRSDSATTLPIAFSGAAVNSTSLRQPSPKPSRRRQPAIPRCRHRCSGRYLQEREARSTDRPSPCRSALMSCSATSMTRLVAADGRSDIGRCGAIRSAGAAGWVSARDEARLGAAAGGDDGWLAAGWADGFWSFGEGDGLSSLRIAARAVPRPAPTRSKALHGGSVVAAPAAQPGPQRIRPARLRNRLALRFPWAGPPAGPARSTWPALKAPPGIRSRSCPAALKPSAAWRPGSAWCP